MDYNYHTQPKTSHPARAVLGLFITFFITGLLITNGCLIALRTTVLKGDDINAILNNSGFYEAVQNAVVEELYKNTKSLGLSREALNEIFPEDTLSAATQTITDAISSNSSVDLSYLKEDCMDIAQSTSETAVNIVFEAYEDSSKVFDAKSIAENPTIRQLEKNYGVNVSETLINEVESTFGTTTIDLTDVDSNRVKETVTDTLTERIYPTISNAFDSYIDNANDIVNKSISTMNDRYNFNDLFNLMENSLKMLTFSIILFIILIVGFLLIELLVYRHSLYRAFRNFSIGTLLSGAAIFILGMSVKFIEDIIFDELFDSFNTTENIIKEFIESNVAALTNRLIAVGAVYIVIFILFMILSSVAKKKLSPHRI